MAVEVVRGHHAGGAEMVEKYADGASVEVSDGHLLVRSRPRDSVSKGAVIAAFAPGKWAFARQAQTAD